MQSGYQTVPSSDAEANYFETSHPGSQSSQPRSFNEKLPSVATALKWGSVILLAIVSMAILLGRSEFTSPQKAENLSEFDSLNRYILRDFDMAKPMTSFLNGIAGVWGVPMWAFYVNRGQGIAAFGRLNKDGAIAKYVTAEKAYQQTPYTGFRTILKGSRNGHAFQHMPFHPRTGSQASLERDMIIGLNEMEIEERNDDLHLQTNVLYFVAPSQDFPALVRRTTFTNTDSSSSVTLHALDGLAKLIPNGLSNYALDSMGRTMEAWMNVYNVGHAQDAGDKITQPFFHISQDTADTAQVRLVKDGYFSVAFVEGQNGLLPFIVDPFVVFGQDTSLSYPFGFLDGASSAQDLAESEQGTTSRTPCAFAAADFTLQPGENFTITTVYGYAESLEAFVNTYTAQITAATYAETKRKDADDIAEKLTSRVVTQTSSPLFDAYVKQDFLDNLLRGGLPMLLGNKVFHVYSRIHGDLERDYNNFLIDTTYFSQGPGAFRDVAQNRRLDTFYEPATKDLDIRLFLTFVQADGYNPLTVASTLFRVPPDQMESVLDDLHIHESKAGNPSRNFVRAVLGKSFRPGQFFRDLSIGGVTFDIPRDVVIERLLTRSEQFFVGLFQQNGFWSDHWTYTLDLLESYLGIYPDEEQAFLFKEGSVAFFMSPAVVRPRLARYSLAVDSQGHNVVRSYSAIAIPGDADYPSTRVDALNAIYSDPNLVADGSVGGFYQRAKDFSVMKVSPIAKLLMLGVLKFSTLDPYGMGVEMEGGKPGWNDAMNGLPGLLGSGMPETYEMLRVLTTVRSAVQRYPSSTISVPEEFHVFLEALDAALAKHLDELGAGSANGNSDFNFWDASNTARETYRKATEATFSGTKATLSADLLLRFLTNAELKVRRGIAQALLTTSSGLSPTYFYYDCTNYAMVTVGGGASKPNPLSFEQRSLPLFLEGPTRHLKVATTEEERRAIYAAVRASPMYDQALKMYTLCESLGAMGQEIGRMKAFSPGWLENQSVWLHMSYKFYLELLRGGLYAEFFDEIRTGLVPFMGHNVYGRSPLEAASFIVSSAFPDRKMHGSSFQPRLSGTTAEFLSMWALMFAGHAPFSIAEKQLVLRLQPLLPAWLFDANDRASFTFLGAINVTYSNPSKQDTWHLSPVRYELHGPQGDKEVDAAQFTGQLAEQVRQRAYTTIHVTLG